MEFWRSMAVLNKSGLDQNGEEKQGDWISKSLALRIYKSKCSTRVANSRSMTFATR